MVAAEIRRVLETSKEQFLTLLTAIYELEKKAESTISQLI
jgi:hypothetical protein